MEKREAIRLLKAESMMLLSGDGVPVSDLYYANLEAIVALEKREPKKPVEGYVFSEKMREALRKADTIVNPEQKGPCCPACGRHIGERTFKGVSYPPYCKYCGQALKQPEAMNG